MSLPCGGDYGVMLCLGVHMADERDRVAAGEGHHVAVIGRRREVEGLPYALVDVGGVHVEDEVDLVLDVADTKR